MQVKFQKAFTIIELIVVIAIIAVLSGIVLSSVNQFRSKARDARRKADLVSIKKALLIYALDHNNTLPTSGFGWTNGGNGWATNGSNGSTCYGGGDLEDILDGTDPDTPDPKNLYIRMPKDPKCGGCRGCSSNPGGYMYYHKSNQCAVLYASLENPSVNDTNTCTGLCVGNPGYGMNYCVEVKTHKYFL